MACVVGKAGQDQGLWMRRREEGDGWRSSCYLCVGIWGVV